MSRLAIYTVLTGEKEPIGNPVSRLQSWDTDLDIDFICFTDNPKVTSDHWECRIFDTNSLPPEKSSRRPKILPHKYLPEYSFSLYLDNICELKKLPSSTDLRDGLVDGYCYKLFKHSTRTSIIEEALAITELGYDKAETLEHQLNAYSQEPALASPITLSTCTVLLRQHNHAEIIKHSELWWDHVLCFSKRDQMSFDFCRIKTNLTVSYFCGDKFTNDLIHPHSNVSKDRKLANFDQLKYSWLHDFYQLTDPNPESVEARALAGATNNSELLDLLFYLFRSPAGSFHMPRRGNSQQIQQMLAGFRGRPTRSVAMCRADCDLMYWNLSRQDVNNTLEAIRIYVQIEDIPVLTYKSDIKQFLGKANQTAEYDLIFVFNATISDIEFIKSSQIYPPYVANGQKFIVLSADNRQTTVFGF